MDHQQSTSMGALLQRPLVVQLATGLDQRKSGTIVLGSGTQESMVYLHRGVPAKVRTATVVSPLDEILLTMGVLGEDELIDSYELACDSKALLGETLLLRGLIEPTTLGLALRRQLQAKVQSLFELPPETGFCYHDGANLLDTYGGAELFPCEPLPLIVEGSRAIENHPHMQEVLARLGPLPLALHGDFEGWGLKAEAPVVALLRRFPMTLEQLLAAGVAPEPVVRRTVYALMLGQRLHSVPRAAGAVVAPDATEMSEPNPLPRTASALSSGEIMERLAGLHCETPQQALGLAVGASSEEVRTAFYRLSLRFHPELLASGLASQRVQVEAIFEHLVGAYHALGTVQRTGPGSVSGERQKLLDGAELFTKAKTAFAESRYGMAEKMVRRAVALDPEQVEYRTFLAWVLAAGQGETASERLAEHYAEPLEILRQVLAEEPRFEAAQYYRGVLLRRAGRPAEALAAFRYLLKRNPRHVDAARELRLDALRSKRRRGFMGRLLRTSPSRR